MKSSSIEGKFKAIRSTQLSNQLYQ